MISRAKKKPAAPTRAGRPTIYGEAMKCYPVRMTAEHNAKLDRLGGAAWLRKKIDAAKDPAER